MFRSIYIFFRESFLIYAEVTKSVKLIQLKYLLRWLLQIISRLFILIFKCYWFCNFNIYKKRLPEGNIHKSKHVRVFIIQTNKCTIYIYKQYFMYRKYSYMFRCASLITFRWPYVFNNNSLQYHTYKTVQTVRTATKLPTSMYCNCNSWQLTAVCKLYFNINCNDNILIYWFYWVCNFNDFCKFSKVEG